MRSDGQRIARRCRTLAQGWTLLGRRGRFVGSHEMDADLATFRLLTLYQRLRHTRDPLARRTLQRQMDLLIEEQKTSRARVAPAVAKDDRDRRRSERHGSSAKGLV
jgi:hypothetical protein